MSRFSARATTSGLPAELLPPDWPRARARELFDAVYDGLGPLAEMRFRQILRTVAPDIAELSTHVRPPTSPGPTAPADRRAGR